MKKLILLLFLITACTTKTPKPIETPVATTPTISAPSAVQSSAYKLSWESGHPERAVWTIAILDLIRRDLAVFAAAKDITVFRPDFKSLTTEQQVIVIGEIFSSISYFECGFDQTEADQDVGDSNKDTWSVGLLQLSVVDQPNYHLSFGYTFKDLQTAVPNLTLGEAIMVQQIKKYGRFILNNNENKYWATMTYHNRYDKSAEIIARVKALKF